MAHPTSPAQRKTEPMLPAPPPSNAAGRPPQAGGGSRKRLVVVTLLLVAAFLYFDLGRLLTFAALQENKNALRRWADAHALATVGLFLLTYCVQTALSLPGAAILTLAGGFLFGTLIGALYVNIGATAGATLAFLASRHLFSASVERRWGARIRPLQDGFSKNAFRYLLTLRLVPIFPFFLVNLVAGLTRITLPSYIAATAIGILPGSLVYTHAGQALGAISSGSDIASPSVLWALALLGLLSLSSIGYSRWKAARK